MRHILVTGGGGYVGGRLVPELLDRGFRVRVLDRFWFSDPQVLKPHPRLQIFQSDTRDLCRLQESLYAVDTVIHLAGVNEVSAPHLSPELIRQINGVAHAKLVEGALQKGVRRFIFLSSTAVYRKESTGELTEDSPTGCETLFQKLLVEAEQEVLLRANRDRFSGVVIRSAPLWGESSPRMRRELPLNQAIHDALLGRPIALPHPDRRHPCLHLDDLVALLIRAVELPSDLMARQIFNACGANPTWGEIGQLLSRYAPTTPLYGEMGETGPTVAAHRVRQRLGFMPRTLMEEGIQRMAGTKEPRARKPKTLGQSEPRDGAPLYSPG